MRFWFFPIPVALLLVHCAAEAPLRTERPAATQDPRRYDDENYFYLMARTVVGEVGEPLLLRLADPNTVNPRQSIFIQRLPAGQLAAELTSCQLRQDQPRCFLHRQEHRPVGFLASINRPSFSLDGYYCGNLEALTVDGWVEVHRLPGPTDHVCVYSLEDQPIHYDRRLRLVVADH